MTSAGSPLSRGALGTQPGAVEERGGRRAAPALRELPRREASEDVPNRGKGHRRPQVPCRPFHHPPPAGSGLAPRPPPWGEVREATWQSGHRTQVVPLFFRVGVTERSRGGGRGPSPLSQAPPPGDSGKDAPRRRGRREAQPRRGAPTPRPRPRPGPARTAAQRRLRRSCFCFSLFLYFTYTLAIQWRSRRESGKDGITEAQ